MIINKPEIFAIIELKILRCDESISVWRLYPLSGTSGLGIIYYVHTFLGQFIPCSFERNVWADPRKDKKVVSFANCVFIFEFFFLGIRQPRNANLFKEKYHVLY